MSFFDPIARALGILRAMTDKDLAEDHEALRLRHVSGEDHYSELHRLDGEMIRRANKAYERDNPNPPERRHREHGWYLPNDD
ncbi:hypothetical protein [Arthrobacter sp. MDT1-65]